MKLRGKKLAWLLLEWAVRERSQTEGRVDDLRRLRCAVLKRGKEQLELLLDVRDDNVAVLALQRGVVVEWAHVRVEKELVEFALPEQAR